MTKMMSQKRHSNKVLFGGLDNSFDKEKSLLLIDATKGKKTNRSSLNVKSKNGYLFKEHDQTGRSKDHLPKKIQIQQKPYCRHDHF